MTVPNCASTITGTVIISNVFYGIWSVVISLKADFTSAEVLSRFLTDLFRAAVFFNFIVIAFFIKQFPLILLLVAGAAFTMIRLNTTLKLRIIGFSITAAAAILIVLLANNSSTPSKVGPTSPTLVWIISYLLITLFMFGISELWFKRALRKQRKKSELA